MLEHTQRKLSLILFLGGAKFRLQNPDHITNVGSTRGQVLMLNADQRLLNKYRTQ